MSKCSCPNSFCRCLYGCACRIENSNAKKNKKCLCCQVSKLSKSKKTNNNPPTHECQPIPDPERVDDIITKLESGGFESVRYGCKVIIEGNLEDFESEIIEEFSQFSGTLEYDLPQRPNFDGNPGDKKIIIVNSSNLYCIGISISDKNIIKINS